MDNIVNKQQHSIDTIEDIVDSTKSYTIKAEKELAEANRQQNLYRGKIVGGVVGALALGGTTIATFGLNLPLLVGTTVTGSLIGGYLGNSVVQ
jgi:uncharacterized protein YcfJ